MKKIKSSVDQLEQESLSRVLLIPGEAVDALVKQHPIHRQTPNFSQQQQQNVRRRQPRRQQQPEQRSSSRSVGLASTASIERGNINSTLLTASSHINRYYESVSEPTLSEAFEGPMFIQGNEKCPSGLH